MLCALTLDDFLSFEDLSSSECILCLIAVLLFFIVGWCFFDVLWRVFFSRVKFFSVCLLFSVFLYADWGSQDSVNLASINTDIGVLRTNSTTNTSTLTNFMKSLMISTYDSQPSSVGSASSFFGEILYGTKIKKDSPENAYAYSPDYPSNYKSYFGLRAAYKDNSQSYIDMISQSTVNGLGYYGFSLDTFNSDSTGTYNNIPDGFLAVPNYQDIINKTDASFMGADGYTYNSRDAYIQNSVDSSFTRERQSVSRAQSYASAAINKQGIFANLTGTVLSFNLDWLVDYAQAIFPSAPVPDGETPPAPTFMQSWRNRQFVFKLVPADQNDLLYPLYMKWRNFDSIIFASCYILCYGTLLLFIGDKIRAIVEGS